LQTITDAQSFHATVVRARQQGYWLADQYIDTGLAGLAVALTDRKGTCVGAVSMTFQTQAYPGTSALTRLLPPLQEVVQTMRGVV
jgi:IclR family pca regulon transcriptional regulator